MLGEVNVAPHQAKTLAAPHTCQQRQHDERPVILVQTLHLPQNVLCFALGQAFADATALAHHIAAGEHDVLLNQTIFKGIAENRTQSDLQFLIRRARQHGLAVVKGLDVIEGDVLQPLLPQGREDVLLQQNACVVGCVPLDFGLVIQAEPLFSIGAERRARFLLRWRGRSRILLQARAEGFADGIAREPHLFSIGKVDVKTMLCHISPFHGLLGNDSVVKVQRFEAIPL